MNEKGFLMLVKLRGYVKKKIHKLPFIYNLGKIAYESTKSIEDKKAFSRRCPSARYVNYSSRVIKDFKSSGFHSQFGQDQFLFSEVFGKKRNGFFVEIGANDPLWNSNTAYLESQGWQGMSFEPQLRFRSRWLEHRKTPLNNVAISSEERVVEFVEFDGVWEHQLSGFKEFVRSEDLDLHKHKSYEVAFKPRSAFLSPEQKIDILMIDVGR